MCNQPSWSLEEAGSPAEEQQNNVQHIQAVMEEMQLRKQRSVLFPCSGRSRSSGADPGPISEYDPRILLG